MKQVFFIIISFFQLIAIAQDDYNIYSINFGYGSIIKHKESMGHLVTAHPQLFQFNWMKKADTSTVWKKRFNFPDVGLSIFHERFGNTILGNITAINYTTSLYLRNRNVKNNFKLDIGLGFAYSDSPFDFEKNNQNNSISSHATFSQHLKLIYDFQVTKTFKGQVGFLFTHFSNASFKNPNNGINTVFLNTGISYTPQPQYLLQYPKKSKPIYTKKQPINLLVAAKIGFHESYPGLGTKPVYMLSPYLQKKVAPMGRVAMGMDFMFSRADKTYAEFTYITAIENPERTINDARRVGLYAGYQQLFERLIFEVDLGYYLYAPFKIHPNFYENLSFKYAFKKHPFALGIGLKVHNFRADYATLEGHYKIF